jgi:phage terminase large subunit GpA-like protein
MGALDWEVEAKTILSVFQPRPKLTISQWADAHRKLSPEASSEPGQWHTDRAEYLRGVMDAIGDPHVHTVAVMTSSQVGKTEALLNAVGYFIDYDPSPILLVEPTLDMADALSKDRLAVMLRDCPALQGKVRDARARDSNNTILHKQFVGGHITLCGANSPASLASRPIRIVLCDEVDRYEPSAGAEGDPVMLAAKRATTYWNRKLVMTSTPKLKGLSRIEAAFESSDQRFFEVPCPDCHEYQRLRWKNVVWDKDLNANGEAVRHFPQTAHYTCEHCGSCWDDPTRWSTVRRGRWQATKPFSGVAGFHLNEIYSSWVTLETMVRDWLAAQDNMSRLQAFINTSLGDSWELPFEAKVAGHELLARCENYSPNTLPDEIQDLTVGGDTHPDRLELTVWGFGPAEESWAIEHVILRGDPARQEIWVELDKFLLGSYRTVSGRELRIRAACLDSGGHHAQQVTSFCATRGPRRIYAIKGLGGVRKLWPVRSSRSRSGAPIYLLGVDTGKDAIYSRLRGIDKPSPGYIHFPVAPAFDENYFKQLTSERVVTRYHKNGMPYRVWERPSGARNESLDCAVYALAAYLSLGRRREAMVAAPAPIIPGQPQPVSPFPRPTVDQMQERAARLAKLLAQ